MALIRVGGAQKRPHYAQRLFTARPRSGRVVLGGWPAPAQRRPSLYNRDVLNRFRALVQASKSLHPREDLPMRAAVETHARTHTGVRGSANIRLRDLHVQRLSGRLWAIELPGYGTIYPAAVRDDISDAIDWVEPHLGGVLTRTREGWATTPMCEPGAVLTTTLPGPVSGCCPPPTPAPTNQALKPATSTK